MKGLVGAGVGARGIKDGIERERKDEAIGLQKGFIP
jgi:hypothetical protein